MQWADPPRNGAMKMPDRRSSTIRPRYPVFWQAIYDSDRSEIEIPVCRTCGSLIKVASYDEIVCPTTVSIPPSDEEISRHISVIRDGRTDDADPLPSDDVLFEEFRKKLAKPRVCGSRDHSFDVAEGALSIPLIDGVLSEFDKGGNEPLNFRYLPTDGLLAFGLVDPFLAPPTFYMLNLVTGNLEVGYVNSGVAMPIGIGIEFSTKDGRDLVPISTVLDRYGRGGDLIHYKHCLQTIGVPVPQERVELFRRLGLDPHSIHITDIVAGYKCQIPGWHCQVKIQVDCSTHLPFITTKASRIEE